MAPDTTHPYDRVARKTFGPGAVALIGGAVSGGAVAVLSGDWACAALGAAVIGAALSGLTASILGWRAGQRRIRVAAGLAALIGVLAVTQVLWTKAALKENAFRTAFGTAPPATLQGLRVKRHYAGGPGDSVTLMRFNAGPELISSLVAGMPASAETEQLLQDFRAKRLSARDLWSKCFGSADPWAGGWWPADAPAMKDPVLYAKPAHQNQMPPSSTMILWDRGTEDIYVVTTVG